MVSGGGSQSDTICQITASMLNRKVYKTTTHETSGLGAAIITVCIFGMFVTYNEAIEKMVHYKKYLLQKKNIQNVSKLIKKVYKKIYRSLKHYIQILERYQIIQIFIYMGELFMNQNEIILHRNGMKIYLQSLTDLFLNGETLRSIKHTKYLVIYFDEENL